MSDRSPSPRRSRRGSAPGGARHTPRTRDAALRRLKSVNRWLLAGGAGLTGLFTALAANAFPGRTETVRTSAPRASVTSREWAKPSPRSRSNRAQALKAAKSAPTTAESEQSVERVEGEEGGESTSGGESVEASPTVEEEAAKSRAAEAQTTAEPEVVEEATVSGGS